MPGVLRRWYTYNGSGSVDLPSSYIYSPASPSCINGFSLCAISAIYTAVGPSAITANLQAYISNLLSTGVAQPNGLATLPYVYGKA